MPKVKFTEDLGFELPVQMQPDCEEKAVEPVVEDEDQDKKEEEGDSSNEDTR